MLKLKNHNASKEKINSPKRKKKLENKFFFFWFIHSPTSKSIEFNEQQKLAKTKERTTKKFRNFFFPICLPTSELIVFSWNEQPSWMNEWKRALTKRCELKSSNLLHTENTLFFVFFWALTLWRSCLSLFPTAVWRVTASYI